MGDGNFQEGFIKSKADFAKEVANAECFLNLIFDLFFFEREISHT